MVLWPSWINTGMSPCLSPAAEPSFSGDGSAESTYDDCGRFMRIMSIIGLHKHMLLLTAAVFAPYQLREAISCWFPYKHSTSTFLYIICDSMNNSIAVIV